MQKNLKIVIAPDSFKESLSAMAVANEIEAGFREIFPTAHYCKFPMADGGEGTVQAMIEATAGQRIEITVSGPLGEPVLAFYGLSQNKELAIIEMAAASGLERIPPAQRNPLITSSYGTGELIRSALDAGARRLIIGIGGSATNDGGMGMLQALGVQLFDAEGKELGAGGAELARLDHIDASQLDPRLKNCIIDVACDVDNPLLGPTGASSVFGPQKGASPAMVSQLDAALARYADAIARDFSIDVANIAGAGAAGGMGAALLAFLHARLRPGVEIVAEALGLASAMLDADLVITGEGCMDSQTLHGKTPIGVARLAQTFGVPVIGLSGSLADDASRVHAAGMSSIFSAVRKPGTLEEALSHAAINIRSAARNIAATLQIGTKLATQQNTKSR